jgi:hypothetical protein
VRLAINYIWLYDFFSPSFSSGSVYYYILTTSYWSQQSKISAKDGAYNDLYAISVVTYKDNALVGAYGDDDTATDAGMYLQYGYII